MSPVDTIALSGMTAATLKLTASASNLVNAEDETRVGAPGYQPLRVQNTTSPGGGVTAVATTVKPASFFAFDPSSPVASVQGLVAKPEIDPVEEVSNQLQAGHAFAFSLEALKAKDEAEKTLLDLKT